MFTPTHLFSLSVSLTNPRPPPFPSPVPRSLSLSLSNVLSLFPPYVLLTLSLPFPPSPSLFIPLSLPLLCTYFSCYISLPPSLSFLLYFSPSFPPSLSLPLSPSLSLPLSLSLSSTLIPCLSLCHTAGTRMNKLSHTTVTRMDAVERSVTHIHALLLHHLPPSAETHTLAPHPGTLHSITPHTHTQLHGIPAQKEHSRERSTGPFRERGTPSVPTSAEDGMWGGRGLSIVGEGGVGGGRGRGEGGRGKESRGVGVEVPTAGGGERERETEIYKEMYSERNARDTLWAVSPSPRTLDPLTQKRFFPSASPRSQRVVLGDLHRAARAVSGRSSSGQTREYSPANDVVSCRRSPSAPAADVSDIDELLFAHIVRRDSADAHGCVVGGGLNDLGKADGSSGSDAGLKSPSLAGRDARGRVAHDVDALQRRNTLAHARTRAHAHTNTHTHTHTHTPTQPHTHTHTSTHAHTHTLSLYHTHTQAHTHTYPHTN